MRVVPRGIALSLPRRPPLPRRHLAHRLLLRRRRRHLRRQGGAVRARARRGGGRPLLGRGGLRTAHARLAVRALPLLGPLLHVADGVRRRPARDHRPRVRALHHRAGDGRVLLGHHLLPRRAVHQPARRGAAEVRLREEGHLRVRLLPAAAPSDERAAARLPRLPLCRVARLRRRARRRAAAARIARRDLPPPARGAAAAGAHLPSC
mmetsp:Transcript_8748/g.25985  ORF Transcript_8748/g.25985 Transcript_8748/m.25985 type:complete len:207 (-) Transcript_8748:625-1245(-)